MRWAEVLILPLFFVGIGVIVLAFSFGEGEVLLLIFPIMVVRGPVALLGTLLIFASFLWGLLSLRALSKAPPAQRWRGPGPDRGGETIPSEREGRRLGGVVLVGPFPILFGADAETTEAMTVIAGLLAALLLLVFLLGAGGFV